MFRVLRKDDIHVSFRRRRMVIGRFYPSGVLYNFALDDAAFRER